MKIENNRATKFGGGLVIQMSATEVANSTIKYNKCDVGGGVYIKSNQNLKTLLGGSIIPHWSKIIYHNGKWSKGWQSIWAQELLGRSLQYVNY